jgi:hypothetical protein
MSYEVFIPIKDDKWGRGVFFNKRDDNFYLNAGFKTAKSESTPVKRWVIPIKDDEPVTKEDGKYQFLPMGTLLGNHNQMIPILEKILELAKGYSDESTDPDDDCPF